MEPVQLTKEDWVEIYYSVESKAKRVLAGEYGDTTSSKRKWVKHLESIMKKIGPDGEEAVKNGVESLGDEDTVTFDGPMLPGGVLILDPDDDLTLVEGRK
jgi:hypothetical protein